MYKYLATFISGTHDIIRMILIERLKDLRIIQMMDGAVEFETSISYDQLNFFCFNNIFLIIDVMNAIPGQDSINAHMRKMCQKKLADDEIAYNSSKIKTFRIIASVENQLTSVDRNLKTKLEQKIARLTGLQVKKSDSDTEFWFLSRSEGKSYFLKRLSKHTAYDKILQKGELHPELAYMMCKLSQPKHTDVFLDPFCGYGSIPYQRMKRFAFKEIYAFDIDNKVLDATRDKCCYKTRNPNVIIKNNDVMKLDNYFEDESIDCIITDPPWGLFQEIEGGILSFYNLFMAQFERKIKVGGRIVLLTAKKEEFLEVLKNYSALKLIQNYNILVSGKKSAIYVLVKDKTVAIS